MGVTGLGFELKVSKAKIKGTSYRLYCFYGNLSYHEHYHILFTRDEAFV